MGAFQGGSALKSQWKITEIMLHYHHFGDDGIYSTILYIPIMAELNVIPILNKRKVFCIGFNKTGTISMDRFFRDIGLKSLHSDGWPYWSRIPEGKKHFKHQAYADGELSDFVALDRWFRGSVFILNDRDNREWLCSRIKHVLRHGALSREKILTDPRYGKMAQDFCFDERAAIEKWVLEKKIYYGQVKTYFHNKKNFLKIDITADRDWQDTISGFLRQNEFVFKDQNLRNKKEIHANKRGEANINNTTLLQRYYAMVDDVLKAENLP